MCVFYPKLAVLENSIPVVNFKTNEALEDSLIGRRWDAGALLLQSSEGDTVVVFNTEAGAHCTVKFSKQTVVTTNPLFRIIADVTAEETEYDARAEYIQALAEQSIEGIICLVS